MSPKTASFPAAYVAHTPGLCPLCPQLASYEANFKNWHFWDRLYLTNKTDFATPSWRTYTLTDPFTTNDVRTMVNNDLTNMPGWNSTNWVEPCSGGGAGRATTNMAAFAAWEQKTDGYQLSKQKLQYQAVITNSSICKTYSVHWKLHSSAGDYEEVENIAGAGGTLSGRTNTLESDDPQGIVLRGCQIFAEEIEGCASDDDSNSGCSGCGCNGSSTSRPGTHKLWNSGVRAKFNLGKVDISSSAGVLFLAADAPAAALVNPASLTLNLDGRVKVIGDGNSWSCLQAPECMVRVTPGSYQYSLDFYGVNSTGDYAPSPFVSYNILNPNGSTNANTLQIIETRYGSGPGSVHAITNEFKYLGANGSFGTNTWQLSLGNGLRTTQVSSTNYGNGLIAWTRGVIQTPTTAVIARADSLYQTFAWGLGLVSHRLDPGGLNILTTNTYYDDGTLFRTVRGDGSWSIYQYDSIGRVVAEFAPYGNSTADTNAAGRKVTFDYSPIAGSGDDGILQPGQPRTITDYVLGQPVRKQQTVYLANETRSYELVGNTLSFASGALGSTNRYWSDGVSADAPDGTRTLTITASNQNGWTESTWSGAASAANLRDVVDGNYWVRTYNRAGRLVSNAGYDIVSGISLGATSMEYDEQGRLMLTQYSDGTTEQSAYQDCCSLASVIDREGAQTDYTYDDLRRLLTSSRLGVTNFIQYDSHSNRVVRWRVGTGGTNMAVDDQAFDQMGRLLVAWDAETNLTTYNYVLNSSGSTRTVIAYTNASSGVSRIEASAWDGSSLNVGGSGQHGLAYDYGLENGQLFARQTRLDGTQATSEWTKSYTDFLGRNFKTAYPDGASRQSYFNNLGQVSKEVDPDGVTTLYQYNPKGEREYTITSSNRSDTVNWFLDRVSRSVSFVTNTPNGEVLVRQTWAWGTNGVDQGTLVQSVETSTDGLRSWSSSFGLTNVSGTGYFANGLRYVTNTAADGTTSLSVYQYGRLQSSVRKDANGQQLSSVTYGYDGFGRQTAVTDAGTGTSTKVLDNLGRVKAVTTPAPDGSHAAQTTLNFYDSLGRVWRTVLPDNTSVTNEYFDTGELRKTYGSRTYPVEYTYDCAGRMKTMTTWQSFNSSGAATTTWNYDSARGFLTSKVYAINGGPSYTYTPAGRLASRTWARGIVSTYQPNSFGDIIGISYSDSTSVVNKYDRLGRLTASTNGPVGLARLYDTAGKLLLEDLNGLVQTNYYDNLNRRRAAAVVTPLAAVGAVSFDYDAADRLHTVTAGSASATYSYVDNSPLVRQVAFAQNGTSMTTTKVYDNLNRLTSIASQSAAAGTVAGFSYQYNDANQRTQSTLGPDGSYWVYQYDSLGQVTNGVKYWRDGTKVAGDQFGYFFDDIGNRNQTVSGGDANGSGLRLASYTNNLLNQITSRDVPNTVDILGLAHASATVTVNTSNTYRKGEFYRAALAFTNQNGAAYPYVTNVGVLSGLTTRLTNRLFLAQSPEVFQYDQDGNLTNDGRWAYVWDAENRLVQMRSRTNATPMDSWLWLTFAYDAQGRRVGKSVLSWTNNAWQITLSNRYGYDGWNLLAELSAVDNSLIRSYAWGLDLSGSQQGAGGVGGLLAINDTTNGLHFTTYDGNGNVAAMVSGTSGSVTANYEYGPFGELLRASGPMARVNPFRFSTKYQDDETDLLYYGYRYYSASMGRWINRDPIEEFGGYNVYEFVFNDPRSFVDKFGLDIFTAPKPTAIKYCSGVCGADISDWFKDEIKSQIQGWDAYKAQLGGTVDARQYVWYTYFNMFYKPTKGTGGILQPPSPGMPRDFAFNKGVLNSKGEQCGGGGNCGISVTLCGQCMHASVLGNLMFGMIAKYAGMDLKSITDYVNKLKSGAWQSVDPYDAPVYKVGYDAFPSFDPKDDLSSTGTFCTALLKAANAQQVSLEWLSDDGKAVSSREKCRACDAKTKETQHGGGFHVSIPKGY